MVVLMWLVYLCLEYLDTKLKFLVVQLFYQYQRYTMQCR